MNAASSDASWQADGGTTGDAPAGGNVVFPFPLQAVTARKELRDAVIAALKRANLKIGNAAVTVDSPGNWPYPQDKLPAVCVRSAVDRKTSLTKGNTDFTTGVELDVRAACWATTAEAAQAAIDSLWYQVEQTILLDFYVLQLIQNVTTVESAFEIKADGQVQLAGAIGKFFFETFETFDPGQTPAAVMAPSVAPAIEPLTEITIDVTRPNANPPFTKQAGDVGLTITLSED